MGGLLSLASGTESPEGRRSLLGGWDCRPSRAHRRISRLQVRECVADVDQQQVDYGPAWLRPSQKASRNTRITGKGLRGKRMSGSLRTGNRQGGEHLRVAVVDRGPHRVRDHSRQVVEGRRVEGSQRAGQSGTVARFQGADRQFEVGGLFTVGHVRPLPIREPDAHAGRGPGWR